MRSLGTSGAAAVMGAVLATTAVEMDGVQVPTREGFDLTLLAELIAAIVAAVLGLLIPKPARHPRRAPVAPRARRLIARISGSRYAPQLDRRSHAWQ